MFMSTVIVDWRAAYRGMSQLSWFAVQWFVNDLFKYCKAVVVDFRLYDQAALGIAVASEPETLLSHLL